MTGGLKAPAGAATLSVLVHGVPRELAGGWTDGAADELRESILATLEEAAPGLREALLGHQLLTPAALETDLGLDGGHLLGGELSLDQLWLQRPSLALSRHGTPLPGLYLGGAATHPGGPHACGAGALAAQAVLGRG